MNDEFLYKTDILQNAEHRDYTGNAIRLQEENHDFSEDRKDAGETAPFFVNFYETTMRPPAL